MLSLPSTDHRGQRRPDIGPLLAIPAFREADPRRLDVLAFHTDRLRLPPGRTLVRAGHSARELIVIVAGEAEAHHHDGRVTVLPAGAQLGGYELLHDGRHTATVVAASELDVVVVNGPAVRWAHREGLVHLPGHPTYRAGAVPAARRVDLQARLAS